MFQTHFTWPDVVYAAVQGVIVITLLNLPDILRGKFGSKKNTDTTSTDENK